MKVMPDFVVPKPDAPTRFAVLAAPEPFTDAVGFEHEFRPLADRRAGPDPLRSPHVQVLAFATSERRTAAIEHRLKGQGTWHPQHAVTLLEADLVIKGGHFVRIVDQASYTAVNDPNNEEHEAATRRVLAIGSSHGAAGVFLERSDEEDEVVVLIFATAFGDFATFEDERVEQHSPPVERALDVRIPESPARRAAAKLGWLIIGALAVAAVTLVLGWIF